MRFVRENNNNNNAWGNGNGKGDEAEAEVAQAQAGLAVSGESSTVTQKPTTSAMLGMYGSRDIVPTHFN